MISSARYSHVVERKWSLSVTDVYDAIHAFVATKGMLPADGVFSVEILEDPVRGAMQTTVVVATWRMEEPESLAPLAVEAKV